MRLLGSYAQLINALRIKLVRRGNYDSPKSSKKPSKRSKARFGKDYFSILKDSDVQMIVALIDRSKMGIQGSTVLFEQAYSFLVERFEYFLDSLDCYGSIIMDEAKNSKEVTNLRIAHRKILKEGVIVDHLPEGTDLPLKYKRSPTHKYITDWSSFFVWRSSELWRISSINKIKTVILFK